MARLKVTDCLEPLVDLLLKLFTAELRSSAEDTVQPEFKQNCYCG